MILNTKLYFHRWSGIARCVRRLLFGVASAGLLCTISVPGWSQQSDPAARALRKAQGMLRQLSSEKKALQAKIAELEKKVFSTEEQVSQAQSETQQLQGVNAAIRGNNASLMERIRGDHAKFQALVNKYRSEQAKVMTYQHDHALLKNAVAERDQWIVQCRKKNSALIASGNDLIARYNGKSVWDTFVESEPVLGLGQVDAELENQEYRFKLEDLRVQPMADSKPDLRVRDTDEKGSADPVQQTVDHDGRKQPPGKNP